MAISDYPTYSRDKLLSRLGDIISSLAETYTEMAYTRSGELSAKMDAYTHSHETSITGRDNEAKYAAATHTLSLYDLEGRERALTEEKWYILELLKYAE